MSQTNMIDALISEINAEYETLKRHFKCIPDALMNYKPHEKSMSMGALSVHCIETIGWIDNFLFEDEFHFDPTQTQPLHIENQASLLEKTDELLAKVTASLKTCNDETLMKNWKMIVAGKTIFETPKIGAMRAIILSHLIHHRGQLTVYMRLNDIALPSTYGPTADQQSF